MRRHSVTLAKVPASVVRLFCKQQRLTGKLVSNGIRSIFHLRLSNFDFDPAS